MDIKSWKSLTDKQKRQFCFKECLIPSGLIPLIWDSLTEDLKEVVCAHQQVPEDFIRQKWDSMTDIERALVCIGGFDKVQNPYPSIDFLMEFWAKMTEIMRDDVCYLRCLPLEFVEKLGDSLTERQKMLILKKNDMVLSGR